MDIPKINNETQQISVRVYPDVRIDEYNSFRIKSEYMTRLSYVLNEFEKEQLSVGDYVHVDDVIEYVMEHCFDEVSERVTDRKASNL